MPVTTGRTNGKQRIAYETINALRTDVYDIAAFIQVMRGRRGLKTTFESIMPPTVQKGDIRVGCGKLPDPKCMTTFQFTAEITKERLIDEISNPCDANELASNGLLTQYAAKNATAWSTDEARDVFAFISSVLNAITIPVDVVNIYEAIETIVAQVLVGLHDAYGDLAPKRADLMIALSPNVESLLRRQRLMSECLPLSEMTTGGNANMWGTMGVTTLDHAVSPAGVDIMVYVPNLVFTVTTCENDPEINQFNAPGYEPNSIRNFAKENYGFQRFQYPKEDLTDVEDGYVGGKYTITPAP